MNIKIILTLCFLCALSISVHLRVQNKGHKFSPLDTLSPYQTGQLLGGDWTSAFSP